MADSIGIMDSSDSPPNPQPAADPAGPGPMPRLALSRGPGLSMPELAAAYLAEYLDKIRLAIAPLDDDALWWRPAEGTNSIANLMIHLQGNLYLWLLQGVGGEPYERDRAGEFTADRSAGGQELSAGLGEVVEACGRVLRDLPPDDLGALVTVQGYRGDLRGVVFHAVEHMSYHTGQIVWIAKLRRAETGDGFEFYPQHAGE